MPPELPVRLAASTNPIAGGFSWAIRASGLQAGDRIAILGAGQRGSRLHVAAHYAGADFIAVTGLARDEYKLSLARELGADLTINVDAEDPVAAIREHTEGAGVDVVVGSHAVLDGTGGARDRDAASWGDDGARRAEGLTGGSPSSTRTPRPPRGHAARRAWRRITGSYVRALRLIASRRYPIERMHTHQFPLEEEERAIRTLSGETGEAAISITVEP